MTEHPITPPPELVQEWVVNTFHYNLKEKLVEAARWGADCELDACCEWLDFTDCDNPQEMVKELRTDRRPKPISLKEQALAALDLLLRDPEGGEFTSAPDTIRHALEQLDD